MSSSGCNYSKLQVHVQLILGLFRMLQWTVLVWGNFFKCRSDTFFLILVGCKRFQATSLALAVILLTCVQEVHGLIVSWDTEFLIEIFLSFT
jgi:hypothetical protein